MDFYYMINMCEMLNFFPSPKEWADPVIAYDCEVIIMLKQVLTTKFNILIYQDFVILPIAYKVYDLLKWKFSKLLFC